MAGVRADVRQINMRLVPTLGGPTHHRGETLMFKTHYIISAETPFLAGFFRCPGSSIPTIGQSVSHSLTVSILEEIAVHDTYRPDHLVDQ